VVPRRPTNAELRTREYLTEPEVERLMKAAKHGRYAQRDATLILIAFRHGLRASEIADLEWSQHMLRHACGYALANRGHDTRALQAYLGHKNIQHTV
jgi:integrase